PEQARSLADLGRAMVQMIEQNPNEVFLVEGHTDAVGAAGTNLILSDRRAESLALALTEYFDVPPENLVVQGYGESDLRIQTETAERANRRAGVRRITDLMQVAAR
ncbi:MAG: OmpA family protein, partial [Rhodobacterales bacterium]|nr:OmpA family protein [Rhodobacterales bacterium]